MKIINLSRYSTPDLQRFLSRAVRAMGAKPGKVFVILPSACGYTRGCAEVGDALSKGGKRHEARKIAIEIAPPSRLSLRKLARIAEHEILHTMGVTHDKMTEAEYWSLGGVPGWAKGLKVRARTR